MSRRSVLERLISGVKTVISLHPTGDNPDIDVRMSFGEYTASVHIEFEVADGIPVPVVRIWADGEYNEPTYMWGGKADPPWHVRESSWRKAQ
jgi:hypothetical protein